MDDELRPWLLTSISNKNHGEFICTSGARVRLVFCALFRTEETANSRKREFFRKIAEFFLELSEFFGKFLSFFCKMFELFTGFP